MGNMGDVEFAAVDFTALGGNSLPDHEQDPAKTTSWRDTLLGSVSVIAKDDLAPLAHEIDQSGFYPTDILRSLAAVGATSAHLSNPHGHGDFGVAIEAMAEISQTCGSTGFLMWCQAVCGLYLERAQSKVLSQQLLDEHASGMTLGGTALSNPMKSYAQIETFKLIASKTAQGYVVNGSLPWVSNLANDHYCAAIAQIDTDPTTQVMFLIRASSPGVQLCECPAFSGMEGTGTYAVHLSSYAVNDSNLIADPAAPWIAEVRAGFVLLQTGMAAGIIRASIDSIRAAEPTLGHVNGYLPLQADSLHASYSDWYAEVQKLAQTPFDRRDEYFLAVLRARAQGSQLCLDAAQAALLHQGARGYLLSSPVQRRIRESHFVAIVTPALKHLQREIARLEDQK